MTFKKLLGWLIFLGIIGGGIWYFYQGPGRPIVDRITGQYKPVAPRPPETAVGAFGIAMDQGVAGMTGETQVGALQRVKSKLADADLATIRNAIYGDFYVRFNRLPNDLDELRKAGSLSSNSQLKDPFGTPYQSKVANGKFYLLSAGPDKVFGTADDSEPMEISRQ
ncbi:MAG: hypothetical protein ACE14V_08555 [bacterium]